MASPESEDEAIGTFLASREHRRLADEGILAARLAYVNAPLGYKQKRLDDLNRLIARRGALG